jgi:hypothetical protein
MYHGRSQIDLEPTFLQEYLASVPGLFAKHCCHYFHQIEAALEW